eukprot:TRINITY_DN3460_c0_g1_i1.p1 TRINITY_DN3460_c0_g1~~TRINITY_DN3460_c0_g1_i1.p1  ORF type:complete len:1214 (-),score=256.36 TRINITY_DN3460_c0_g1_i1:159-3764(-)
MAEAAHLYFTVDTVCKRLVISCATLLNNVREGCDSKTFLAGFQNSTAELQQLVKCVQVYETHHQAEKKEVLTATLAVKNTVIKVITELRALHKSAASGQSAVSDEVVTQLKRDLSTVIQALGASTQKLHLVEEADERSSNELEKLVESVRETLQKITLSVVSSDREGFTSQSKLGISMVNAIIVKFAGIATDNSRTMLRQALVRFITASKSRFMRPKDENIVNEYEDLIVEINAMLEQFSELAIHADLESSLSQSQYETSSRSESGPSTASGPAAGVGLGVRRETRSASVERDVAPGRRRVASVGGGPIAISGEEVDTPTPNPPTLATTIAPAAGQSSKPLASSHGSADSLKEPFIETKVRRVSDSNEAGIRPKRMRRSVSTSSMTAAVKDVNLIMNRQDSIPEEGASGVPTLVVRRDSMKRDTADEIFVKGIIEMVSHSCSNDWKSMSALSKMAFEKAVHQRLEKYKTTNKLERSGRNVSRPTGGAGGEKVGLRVTRTEEKALSTSTGGKKHMRVPSSLSNSGDGRSSLNSLLSPRDDRRKKKAGFMGKFERSTTVSALRKGKKTRKVSSEIFYNPLDMSSVQGETSHTALAKKFNSEASKYFPEIKHFMAQFEDKEIGWSPKPSAKFEDAISHPVHTKGTEILQNFLDLSLEALDYVLNSGFNGSEAMTKIKSRLTEEITGARPPVKLPVDMKLGALGQYPRFFRWNLYKSIYYQSVQLMTFLSQLCATLVSFDANDASDVYFALSLLSSFATTAQETLNQLHTFFHILDIEQQALAEYKFKPPKKKPITDSIWKEPSEPESVDKSDMYRVGTVNCLVTRLTATTYNSDFMSAFLFGYESFSSSVEFWEKLEERYLVPKTAPEFEQAQFVKMRVANVLLRWVRLHFHAIDRTVLGQIEMFAEKVLKKDKFEELSTWIVEEIHSQERFSFKDFSSFPDNIPIFEFLECNSYSIWLHGDKEIIAEQFTLIEMNLYNNIQKLELTRGAWSKEKLQCLSLNVVRLITRVNDVAYFVAMIILLQPRLKDRAKMITQFIGVAKRLHELQNFNSLMGVLTGLSMSPISRLKHSWGKISSRTQEAFDELAKIQDPSNSFKNIRDQLLTSSPTALPYVGTFLSDLTFIDEGNPDHVEVEGSQYVNFQKYSMICRSIKKFVLYQENRTQFQVREPYYSYLRNLPKLEEKELHELSLEREPRNSQTKDLI